MFPHFRKYPTVSYWNLLTVHMMYKDHLIQERTLQDEGHPALEEYLPEVDAALPAVDVEPLYKMNLAGDKLWAPLTLHTD